MDDLTLAVTLARAAGILAYEMRGGALGVDTKGHPSEVVTAADRAAEELVARTVAAERPDDGLLGEEGAGTVSRSGRTWVVDPVDGTWNFVHALPTWCAAVALRDDATGDGLVAAVYQPTTDTVWFAGESCATTVSSGSETRALSPIPDRRLSEVAVATYLHSTTTDRELARWLRLCRAAATVRVLGSGSVDLSFLAEGRLGAYVQPDQDEWDWLPGATLVRGAGGVAEVVRQEGHRWHLAGSPRTVADLREVLRTGS